MSTNDIEEQSTDHHPANLGLSDEVVDQVFATDGLPPDIQDLFDRFLIPLNMMCRDLQSGSKAEPKVRSLANAAIKAAISIKGYNALEVANCFFELGELLERFRWNQDSRYSKMLKTVTANQKRKSGLKNINKLRAEAKEHVQQSGNKLWEKDAANSIRLGEMCERVWSELAGDIALSPEGVFPNTANGLKPWLREVAPDYASKGGRPKTKKT